jgi:hypothetical protein
MRASLLCKVSARALMVVVVCALVLALTLAANAQGIPLGMPLSSERSPAAVFSMGADSFVAFPVINSEADISWRAANASHWRVFARDAKPAWTGSLALKTPANPRTTTASCGLTVRPGCLELNFAPILRAAMFGEPALGLHLASFNLAPARIILQRPYRPQMQSSAAATLQTKADAGPPQTVTKGATVFLNGGKSISANGHVLNFSWKFITVPWGSSASLSDSATVQPSFVADLPGNYVIQLTVGDGVISRSASVTVSTTNSAPTANAGPPQKVQVGSTVNLEGSGSSDPDGDKLNFAWSFVSVPSGSHAVFSDPSTINPTFVADVAGDYVVQLMVSDSSYQFSTASLTISTNNTPPIANAGANQTATVGVPVQLDGSRSSDPDGDSILYAWNFTYLPSGSSATITHADTATPTFTPDAPGNYVLQLTVRDTAGHISAATVTISTSNSAPVAVAGPAQSVPAKSVVQLDGSASSDPDYDQLHYFWSLIAAPAKSTAVLSVRNSAKTSFTADVAGKYLVQLIVNDGVLQSPPSTVLITATAGQAHIDPQIIDFGNQPLNQTSGSKQITISNTGTAALTVNSVSVSGVGATRFGVTTPALPTTVPAGATTSLNVTFSPLALGQQSATVIVNNDPGATSSILLAGTGVAPPQISYSPGDLQFGNQVVGQTTAAKTVFVSNIGAGTLTISTLTLAGSNPGDFAFSAPAVPIDIAPGATNSITITFKPTASGSRSAFLLITDNASGSPHMLTLSGTGIAPAITLSPAAIKFPDTALNTTSTSIPLTVTNSGTATLTITGAGISGTNSADFAVSTPALPVAVKPAGFVIFSVTFTPSATTARSATLNVTSDSANAPNTVALSGNGVGGGSLAANPTSLAFGSVGIGVNKQVPLQLTNNGSAALTIQNFSLTGVNASDFTFTSATLPISVAANSSATIQVSFTPAASGARSASLVVTHNSAGSPLTIPLSGTGAGSAVSLSVSAIDFGNQPVNTSSASKNLLVTNSGLAPLVISAIAFSGAAAGDFSLNLGSSLPVTIQPNGTVTVPITFAPSAPGARAASLLLSDNAPDSPQSVSLTGTGTVPMIIVSPLTVSFASTNVGATSAASTITITNGGTATLQVTGLALSGTNPGDFAFSASPLPIAVLPKASATISLTFSPTASGNRSAILNIANNTGSPQTVALSGNGASTSTSITLSPTSLDFGAAPVSSTTAAKSIVIGNSGGGNLVISSAAISGTNASDFAFSMAPLPLTVTSGGLSVITVTFTPAALGTRSATLTLQSNAASSPHTIALTGSGQGVPVIGLSSSTLDFGSQNVNTTTAPTTLTISNTGNDNLVISSLSLIGFNATEFGFTSSTLPITVAPSKSTTIPLTFTPTGNGLRSASLRIVDNANGSPHQVALSGTGTTPILTISPASVSFNSVSLGTTSSGSTLTLSNTGTGPLSITSLTITGTNSADFAFSATPLPINIAAKASATLSVTFSPSATGTRTASLNIGSNAGSPQAIPLTGTGTITGPHLQLSPASLDFGSQPLNTTTPAKPITISNDGNQDLNITQVAISGANPSDFNFAGPALPIKIPASSNVVIQVAFTASATGARSASLVLTHNAPGSPSSIALSGTGTSPQFTVTPTQIDFGNQNLNQTSSPLSITITNTGTASGLISNITLSGANSQNFAFTVAGGIPATVAPGKSLQVNVTFTPVTTTPVPLTATLTINHNAPMSPAIVTLKGTGTTPGSGIAINPSSVNFGSQPLNTSTAVTNVAIFNNSGSSNLIINSLSILGTNATDFQVIGAVTPISIGPSSSATLSLVFTPSAPGSRNATLSINDTAVGSPHAVPLSGTGIINGPAISLPTSVDFGNQLVTSSSSQTLMIANSGSKDLTITNLTLQGMNAADFALSGVSIPLTIAAGTSKNLSITFTPGAPGARSAALVFTDNSVFPASPQSVSLTGFGTHPVITFNPAKLDFGDQLLQTTSNPLTLTIGNTGDGALVITAIASSAPAFQLTAPSLPLTIAPQTTASVTVTFAPTQAGPNSGTLTLADNASGSPHTVAVSGSGTAPVIVLPTAPYNVGSQLVQTTSPVASIPITNSGTAPLIINGLSMTGTNSSEFALVGNSLPMTIAAGGGTGTITLTFAPGAAGTRNATLMISDNVAGSPQSLALVGTGTTGPPPIAPSGLAFGSQQVSTTSAPLTITATNASSNLNFVITSATLSGTNATDFHLSTPSLPLSIPPNGTATFTVTFAPTAQGTRSAVLTFVDNFPGSPQAVSLAGNGTPPPSLTFSPNSVQFVQQAVNTTSSPSTLNLSNNGGGTITVSAIVITGAQSGDFSFSAGTLPLSIPSSGTVPLTVSFTPSDVGTRTASLVLTDTASGSPHTVPLSGTGVGTPIVSLDKNKITFAAQSTGTPSAPETVTITNTGTAPLVISSVGTTGMNATDFSATAASGLPISVAPNTSTTITLVFTPSGTGTRSAALSITDNASGSPHTVTLAGNGIAPQVTLSSVNVQFPDQQVNKISAPATITVSNAGSASLTITALNLTGTNPGDFAVSSSPLPITVAPGASTPLSITFTPLTTGARNASLSIVDNASDSPQTVTLNGKGVVPIMAVNPAPPYNFNTVVVGNTSAAISVGVANTGSGPLTITNIALAGSNPGDFAFTAPSLPVIIPAGGSPMQIGVTFTPLAGGARTASLVLTSNASDSPRSLSLTGTGNAVPVLALNPKSPINFPDQALNQASNPITVTLSNTGSADLNITSLVMSGAQASEFTFNAPALPITVKPQASATVTLTFTPVGTGARTATFAVTSNAPSSPDNLTLNGNGVGTTAISVPQALDFGGQLLGTTSASTPVTVGSTGTANLVISAVTVSGANANDFILAPVNVPVVVNPTKTANFLLTFKPGGLGTRTASLTFVDNASGSPHVVTLTGQGTQPAISASQSSPIDFKGQLVGVASSPISLVITNSGTANLVLQNFSWSGSNPGDFNITAAVLPITLAPNAQTTFQLTFKPTATGTRSVTLSISHNAPGSVLNLTLTGTGTLPVFTLSVPQLTFADQVVNTVSGPLTADIQNTGTGPLIITGLTKDGTNVNDFAFTSAALPITLGPTEKTTLSATFTPTMTGSRNAIILITDNAAGSPHALNLLGKGIQSSVVINPSQGFSFGSQLINTSSTAKTVTITNNGTADLNISSFALGGTNPDQFAFTSQAMPIKVPANQSTTVNVTFNPTNKGNTSAVLLVNDDAVPNQQSVALSGTGTAPVFGSDKQSLAFNQQLVGTPTPLTLTVSNSGDGNLILSSIVISGPNASDFTPPALSLPITVAPQLSTPLTVTFNPGGKGPRSATLTITDNATGSPHTFALSGTGIQPVITITPSQGLTFASQNVGATSAPQSVTIGNTGDGNLIITGLSLTGTNPGDFVIANGGTPITVAPQGSVTLNVSFAPTGSGTRSANVTLQDNAPGAPHQIPLSGTGTAPVITFDPSGGLSFAAQNISTSSAPLILTVSNSGNGDLQINSMAIGGANASEFSFTPPGTFPLHIAPQGSTSVNVVFTPTVAGTRNATLVFNDNAPGNPHSVPLAGLGQGPAISLTPAPPNVLDFGTVVINTTSGAQSVTIGNTGNAALQVTSLGFTGTDPGDFLILGPSAPLTVQPNQNVAVSLAFHPTMTGKTSNANFTITDNAAGSPHTVAVKGTSTGSCNLNLLPLTVGQNLETLATASLTCALKNDIAVTVTSSDSSLVRLSTDTSGTTLGGNSVTVTIAGGSTAAFPGFYVQSLAGSGSVTLTASATGMTNATTTVTLSPAGFQLSSPGGIGVDFTATAGAADTPLLVSAVRLDSSNNPQPGAMRIRGGLSATVPITSSDTNIGTIVGTATIAAGTTNSSAASFHAVNAGNTTLAVGTPSGFSMATSGRQLVATVQAPVISMNPVTVGSNLQVRGVGILSAPAPANGVAVTITSLTPSTAQLSTSPTAAGSSSVILNVPAGVSVLPTFYVYGMAVGAAQLQATATGYTTGSGGVAVTPSGFLISGPSGVAGQAFSTSTASPNSPLTISAERLDSNGNPLSSGTIRGGLTVSVKVISSDATVGVIQSSPAVFQSGTSSVTTVAFDPVGKGTTTLSLDASSTPGFSNPSSGGTISVSVTLPQIQFSLPTTNVGLNLQLDCSAKLTAPAPSPSLTVTISSNNPQVVLSSDPTLAGSSSITLSVAGGAGVDGIGFPAFYAQALPGNTGGTAVLTASAPGYEDGTATLTITPSGFTLSSVNGLGQDFGMLSSQSSSPLTVAAMQLNSGLAPQQQQSVRGGLSLQVNINSQNPSIGTVTDGPATFGGGIRSQTVHFIPSQKGTTLLSIPTPDGFSIPSIGASLNATVN